MEGEALEEEAPDEAPEEASAEERGAEAPASAEERGAEAAVREEASESTEDEEEASAASGEGAASEAAAAPAAAAAQADDPGDAGGAKDVGGGSGSLAAAWQPAREADDGGGEPPGLVRLRLLPPSGVSTPDGRQFAIPQDTFDKLYPYQREGVAWMARLWRQSQGGVLADEMGLGKTVQVCAFLNGARKAGATHALLLLPVTLLDQWAREARRWCPGWPVYTYYGTAAQRVNALRRVSRPQGGLLLTTYNLIGNTEDLHRVIVDDAPSPRRKGKGGKGRGRGERRAGKRRKLDDDEGFEEMEVDEEPQPVELLPPELLGSSGDVRPWDIVVCDEAHRMKNISTLLGKSLRQLRSSCRLLLTGTPVQNALQDLWAIMDFAQPGLLGNHATFVKTFSEPIERGSVRGADAWSVQLRRHLAEQLRALIAPHILRRTKVMAGLVGDAGGENIVKDSTGATDEDVEARTGDEGAKLLLPKKETVIWLSPTEEQVSAYQRILEKSEVVREACARQKMGVEVFCAIGLLKRLCNHPLLLVPTPSPGSWAELLNEAAATPPPTSKLADTVGGESAAESVSTQEDEADGLSMEPADGDEDGAAEEAPASAGEVAEALVRELPRDSAAMLSQSAKLRCLRSLLPALVSRGHRVLMFSQSLKMLDLVQMCCLKPLGLRCLRIDGKTNAQARAEKVAKFNAQPERFQCMLLTTHVGGVGLNLTSADRVVIIDPAWNPATDAQAVDRAFRIGQTREVRVYRLIMSGLIEDKMFRLQVFKMGLTKTALEATQQQNYFTSKEIRALFEWTDPAEGETRVMLEGKRGEDGDGDVHRSAEEDGGAEWLPAGPAVGLSDFAALYGAAAGEAHADDSCNAQVAEAKEKLGAADTKLERALAARREAEIHRDSMAKDLEETKSLREQLKEKRAGLEEALKDRRAELGQARRAEGASQQRLEKARKHSAASQDGHARSQQVLAGTVATAEEAAWAAQQAADQAKGAEDALLQAVADAEAEAALVDDSGTAVGGGVVDASVVKLRAVQRRLEKVRAAVAARRERQAELELADEEVLRADRAAADASGAIEAVAEGDAQALDRRAAEATSRTREAERQKAEQARDRAQQKVDAAREAVLQAAQAAVEGAQGFAESFEKTRTRCVRSDQVKTAQSNTKAVFRQLLPACAGARKAREACTKAIVARRKAAQKALAASAEVASAECSARHQEGEFSAAALEEEALRGQRGQCERRLAEAEAAKAEAEAEEAEAKQRREGLRRALPAAREALAAAKAAEREAVAERQALHSACSKVESRQLEMEEAKSSAIRTLRAEQYDATQVVSAYEKRKATD